MSKRKYDELLREALSIINKEISTLKATASAIETALSGSELKEDAVSEDAPSGASGRLTSTPHPTPKTGGFSKFTNLSRIAEPSRKSKGAVAFIGTSKDGLHCVLTRRSQLIYKTTTRDSAMAFVRHEVEAGRL